VVKMNLGVAVEYREGVYHACMRRLDTESPMDKRPSVLRPDGRLSTVETVFTKVVS
jgi:hypothetical protein